LVTPLHEARAVAGEECGSKRDRRQQREGAAARNLVLCRVVVFHGVLSRSASNGIFQLLDVHQFAARRHLDGLYVDTPGHRAMIMFIEIVFRASVNRACFAGVMLSSGVLKRRPRQVRTSTKTHWLPCREIRSNPPAAQRLSHSQLLATDRPPNPPRLSAAAGA
jgi:hypothetical protein